MIPRRTDMDKHDLEMEIEDILEELEHANRLRVNYHFAYMINVFIGIQNCFQPLQVVIKM